MLLLKERFHKKAIKVLTAPFLGDCCPFHSCQLQLEMPDILYNEAAKGIRNTLSDRHVFFFFASYGPLCPITRNYAKLGTWHN